MTPNPSTHGFARALFNHFRAEVVPALQLVTFNDPWYPGDYDFIAATARRRYVGLSTNNHEHSDFDLILLHIEALHKQSNGREVRGLVLTTAIPGELIERYVDDGIFVAIRQSPKQWSLWYDESPW